jgi:hypothetical protein
VTKKYLYTPQPDPGPLPTKSAPKRRQKIQFRVNGLPPFKEIRASIRNPKHPHYSRFTKLRTAAIKAMDGRCWYDDGISMDIRIYSSELDKGKKLSDYLSGIDCRTPPELRRKSPGEKASQP